MSEMGERQSVDKPLRDLIEIIHFTENVSAKIHGLLDEAEIYRVIREEFAKSKQYSASILLLTDDGSKLRIAETTLSPERLTAGEKATGFRLEGFEIDLKRSSIYRQVVREGKTLQVSVSDIIGELFSHPLAHTIAKIMGYEKKYAILTPLILGEKIVGALGISSTELAEHFIPSVRNLARHISAALELADENTRRKQAQEVMRRQRDELAARNAILSATLRTSDLDELLGLALDEVLAFLGVEFASIHLVQGDQVVLRAWRHLPAAFRAEVLSFPAAAPPDWMRELCVVHEHLNDVGVTPQFAKSEGIQAWASVPLRLPPKDDGEGAWLGTLMVGCRCYEALSEEDAWALQAMSDQLALAIDHIRTYRQARERLARLQTLRDIDRAIIQSLDLREVLHVVLERVPKELGADAAAISLLNEEPLRTEVFQMRLDNGTFVEEEVFELANSLLHWFVKRQEPVIIYDLTQDPRVQMHRERIRSGRLVSYLGVPLVVRDKTIGILHIMTTRPRVFADEDIAFFRTMAGQAAIAIENARLYQAVKQELAERIEAEEALQTSENRLAIAVAAAGLGIYEYDVPLGKECYHSKRWAEILGYELDELPPPEERLEWVLEQIHLDDRPALEKAYADFIEGRIPKYEVEVRMRHKSGGWIYVNAASGAMERDESGRVTHLVGVMQDITERKRAEEEQARLRRRLEALWEMARMADADYRTLCDHILAQIVALTQSRYGFYGFLNEDESVMRLYSWSKEAIEECRIRDKPREFPIAQAGLWAEAVRQRKTLIINDYQADHPGKKGLPEGHVPLSRILVVPIFSHGRIAAVAAVADKATEYSEEDAEQIHAFVVNAQAILERREAQEALAAERALLARRVEERTAELRRANAELARASRLKDEFLASMSHELRTPLNAILGLSEALQEEVYGPLNERQRKSLHTIEESGRLLLALINDILDVSKIEADKVELEIGPVSVETICQASLGLIKQEAHRKQLKVSSNLEDAPATIQADQRRLKQILVNLLSNAVKFTPEGGEIGLEVVGDAEREAVHFTVWDTGIGISPEDMKRLFEPFVQLDSSLTRQYTGTGLGLTLVHRLTELHGGGVTVKSEVGKGSRFTVSLPWRKGDEGKRGRQKDKETESLLHLIPPSAAHPVTILLAEDNEESLTTLSDYLRMRGCRVIVARNGLEALKRAREERPNLILMDIQMRKMDGLEATRRIRADPDPQVAGIPIIALTALAMPGDRERCLEAGANEYLSKPVSLKRLVTAIEAQLSQPQPGS